MLYCSYRSYTHSCKLNVCALLNLYTAFLTVYLNYTVCLHWFRYLITTIFVLHLIYDSLSFSVSIKLTVCIFIHSAGHRFRQTFDYGFLSLDILYTYSSDTGLYVCKVSNKYGTATSQCHLLCDGNCYASTKSS